MGEDGEWGGGVGAVGAGGGGGEEEGGGVGAGGGERSVLSRAISDEEASAWLRRRLGGASVDFSLRFRGRNTRNEEAPDWLVESVGGRPVCEACDGLAVPP